TTEGLKFTSYPIENKVSKFDLTFEMVEEQEGWTLNIEYATSLFKATTIERMAKHYQLLLEKMVRDSTCAIETYEVVIEEEKRFIHQVFNATEVPYSDEVTLHEVFERQVQKTPHKVAARFGESSITYEVLNQKATNLAKVLRRKGIGKNQIVGLMVERSLEMIIGIMGILKAGGAYMPISPDYPSERIAYMIADSKAKVVLTQQRFEERIKDSEAINLEDEALYTSSEEPLVPINDPRQLAYVIFTSGSTGQPKGVMIEHTSAINRIEWMQKYYPLKEEDTILQKTPFTFDVSVWELFWWMFTGSDVYFLEPQGEKDPQGMLKVIQQEKITTMHFVPSMLSVFMEYYEMFQEKHDVSSLKKVFASGEALTPAQVQSFNRLFAPQGTGLYNLYGPTEATVDVSFFNCPPTGDIARVPIGKPIDNTRLYVLDNQKRIQPIGVAGELYISGIGVGRGYLNKEELTQEKFMDDPYFEGYRMYRSGDLVKLAEDGEIEYLGRMDHQVKLRGLRIELGEIESAIAAYPAIVESAVLLREDGKGEKYLCGYYTAKAQVVIEELKYHLGQKLPEYMVPSFFVEMDYMPLSANGKLDRKALPEPERNLGDKTNYVAAQNTLQQQLITLWESLLEHDNIGIYDNFFDLGGHSLLLVKMHGELEKAYPGMLRITDLFEHTSIDKLAAYIEHLQRKENLSRVLKGVKVQESYLTHQVGHEMSDIETFTFQEPLYHQLSELAISLSVQVEDVMRAAYLVYITQLSEDEKASIEINQGDGMNTVTIQMQDYATFEELIQWVATATRDTKSMYTYEEAKRSLEDQCIIFAYLSGETKRAEREWLQKYDVIFSSTEKGGCRMAYNSSKLRSEAMLGFIDTYLRVLIYVLGEIEGVQYTNERV
ncbi:MAG: non-ribosomal peptide synthetase, partial [Cellulosilyticaceae bacterium]